jgi:hypothetical protein
MNSTLLVLQSSSCCACHGCRDRQKVWGALSKCRFLLAVCLSITDEAAAAAGVCGAGLRFACLLPPGHLLTKTAEQLQRQQEFETALQASKAAAAAAAAAARAQQHTPTVPMLQLPGQHVHRYGECVAALLASCIAGSAHGWASPWYVEYHACNPCC